MQGALQIASVFDGMHRDPQNLAIDAQLFISANTEAVSGDQRQLLGAETHHAACCELGGGGGFANAGRPGQGIDPAGVHHGVFVFQNGELPRQFRLDVVHARGKVMALGQLGQNVLRQAGAEARPQHGPQELAAQRVAVRLVRPGHAVELVFDHAAHRMNLAQQTLFALGIRCRHSRQHRCRFGSHRGHHLDHLLLQGRQNFNAAAGDAARQNVSVRTHLFAQQTQCLSARWRRGFKGYRADFGGIAQALPPIVAVTLMVRLSGISACDSTLSCVRLRRKKRDSKTRSGC